MKKILSLLLFVAVLFVGCKEKNQFNYPLETLYGTWQFKQVKFSPSEDYQTWLLTATYATFYSDGTYTGRGYFGNGKGTYETKGDDIITYVQGEEYATYTVLSLTGSRAELKMSMPGSSRNIWLICEKQN
ncbi:MAG: lipocalin family protein [Paludibacteraceae bacterium]|nr:lipocalin family protein [Paludibacteraceae bacterium]